MSNRSTSSLEKLFLDGVFVKFTSHPLIVRDKVQRPIESPAQGAMVEVDDCDNKIMLQFEYRMRSIT